MLKFSKFVYMKLLKSVNTKIYFSLVMILQIWGLSMLKGNLSETVILDNYLNVTYFITLGVFLWIFILIDVTKYFRIKFDQGVLLNYITKPLTRTQFMFSILIGIFLNFFTIVTFTLIVSFMIWILFYNFLSIVFFKLFLALFLFSVIHIIFIIIILSFISILIKRTEFSILINVLILVFLSLSALIPMLLKDITYSKLLNIIPYFYSFDSLPLSFLIHNIFNILDNGVTLISSNLLQYIKDYDLGYSVYSANLHRIIIENYYLLGIVIFHAIILTLTIYLFKKHDIS